MRLGVEISNTDRTGSAFLPAHLTSTWPLRTVAALISMKHSSFRVFATLTLALSVLIAPVSQADEGFWLFNAPPLRKLQEKYHFSERTDWENDKMRVAAKDGLGFSKLKHRARHD